MKTPRRLVTPNVRLVLLVTSVTLVAVRVYTPAVAGAVYVAVRGPEGVNDPPVALHVTPLFCASLVTVAVTETACPVVRLVSWGDRLTPIPDCAEAFPAAKRHNTSAQNPPFATDAQPFVLKTMIVLR